MTIKKITNFVFPVGTDALSQDAYYRALSEAESGFYPFSENGLWHGGIHVDDNVFNSISRNNNQIRCMANGEVIAYRVNSVYPKITYDEKPKIGIPYANDKESIAYFSTGFTLVRHYFVMPKIAGESTPPPSITLYSLYMHQLDWYGYQQKANNQPIEYPHYWQLISGQVSNNTTDRIKGTTVRRNGAKTEQLYLLLKGSTVKLGEELIRQKKHTGWYKVTSVDNGAVITLNGVRSEINSLDGYVHRSDLDFPPELGEIVDKDTVYTIKNEGNGDLGKENNKQKIPGIIVYGSTDGKKILAYLPKGTAFDFDGHENGYAKIKKIHSPYIPAALIAEGSSTDAPHQGWVKISNLTALDYKPRELDKIVILDKPTNINHGDFIGYMGHNVSRQAQFLQSKTSSLSNEKRPADNRLTLQGHFELFTCDDLPSFISQTRALADKLPDTEKSLVVVEKGAQLIDESPNDGAYPNGTHIIIKNSTQQSYYVQANNHYVLNMKRYQCRVDDIIHSTSLDSIDTIRQPMTYRLSADDKSQLVKRYQFQYPKLTTSNIPDIVELMGYELSSNNLLSVERDFNNDQREVAIKFSLVGDKAYWIRAQDVAHLLGSGEGQLNQSIGYWHAFPLSLTNSITVSPNRTVFFPRTIPLSSIKAEHYFAIDGDTHHWVYITAANDEGMPISGWVNISKGNAGYLQAQVRRASPWEWIGFDSVKDNTQTGVLLEKLNENKKMTLDLADYSLTMDYLHRVLTKTPLNQVLSQQEITGANQEKATVSLPPFTRAQLKDALRTPWTAELIGRLAVNYESEWYADENLSKWNEIDEFYQKQTEQKRQAIIDKLTQNNNIPPAAREHACKILDEKSERELQEWNIEKQQRIKPSLWWDEVAKAQGANSSNNTSANQPVLSNLSSDGKAWYLHPVPFTTQSNTNYYINDDGYIEDAGIIFDKIPHIERNLPNKFNAIILHRTAVEDYKSVLAGYKKQGNVLGTHFVISRAGDIYQCASLFKHTNHIGKIRMRAIYEMRATEEEWSKYKNGKSATANSEYEMKKNYPDRFPMNSDAIGIEVAASYYEDKKQWQVATQEQLDAVTKLVPILQNLFKLTDDDLYQHQHISAKKSKEGWGLYLPSDINNNVYSIIDYNSDNMLDELKKYKQRYKNERGYK